MTWAAGALIWPRACEPWQAWAAHLSKWNWSLLARPHGTGGPPLGCHVLGSAAGVLYGLFVDLERRCPAEQRPVGDKVAEFSDPHSWPLVNLEVSGEIL